MLIEGPVNGADTPIVVEYQFGRGMCIVSGTTDGYLHNQGQNNVYGFQSGQALVYYLDFLANAGISWLTVEPADGTVEPGQDAEIELTWDPTELEEGEYNGIMTIESNDPENGMLLLDVTFVIGLELRFFTEFEETEEFHTLHITEATLDNDGIGAGWEIGVFDRDGNLGGASVWMGQATDVVAYSSAEGIDQFEANDAFIFTYWDPDGEGENGRVWLADADFADGPEVWNGGSESTLSLSAFMDVERTVELGQGWGMMSINIVIGDEFHRRAEGPDVRDMFADFADYEFEVYDGDLTHNIILLKNGIGRFWNPEFGFTNIDYWNYPEGYLIKLNEAADITWEGATIPADADIPMSTDWNMIAYFPTYALDASSGGNFYVLSPIIDRVIIAKEGSEGHFMIPAFGFSNMQPWSQGFGYQVKLNDDGDDDIIFNYPEEQDQEGAFVGEDVVNGGHWATPTITNINMSVLITEINGLKLEAGDQIAAFSSSGRQIGLGTISDNRCGLAVWGNDETTELLDGALAEEEITLKLWDADQLIERDLEVGAWYVGSELEYETNAFIALAVTVQALVPDEYSLSQNFPNPFNAITTLNFGLPEDSEVLINVFDISGRLVTTLVDGQLNAGTHNVSWNAQNDAAGLYLVKMETLSGFVSVKKVTLLK